MSMFLKNFNLLILLLSLPAFSRAQKSYHEMVEDYIAQYKDLAVAEQLRSGVPAAITLAQGIYETGAGSSELCTNAANHFGIKCKNNWTGATYSYSDDRKDECFRKYKDAAQSYRDHSDFLKHNPRYSSLFQLEADDYEDWANGLRKCGYATNPLYAQKLIQTIEDYQLQEFTALALGDRADAADREDEIVAVKLDKGMPASVHNAQGEKTVYQSQARIPESEGYTEDLFAETKSGTGITGYYEPSSKNGLKGMYARKGDLLLEYAIKHHIRYAKLLEWNDLPDAAMPADLFIYLEAKRKTGLKETYTVMPGMNLLQISQETGVQLEQLRKLNQLAEGEHPVAGTVLNLQKPIKEKPEVYAQAQTDTRVLVKTKPEKPEYIYVSHDEGFAETQAATPEVANQKEPSTSESEVESPEKSPVLTESEQDKEAIAEEPDVPEGNPVNEIIPEPQKQLNPAGETQKEQPAHAASEMTPLERLKAHMDQVVYGKQGSESPSPSGTASPVGQQDRASIVTLPAAKRQAAKTEPITASKTIVRFYVVKQGDTAFGIAKKFGVSLNQLKEWNQLPTSMTVQKGMKLQVAK